MFDLFGLPFGFPWESADAFLRRGIALFKKGWYWWAAAAFSTAIRKDASNVTAYRWRSQAYMMLGYDKNADRDYEKIQELEALTPRETPSTPVSEEAEPLSETPEYEEKSPTLGLAPIPRDTPSAPVVGKEVESVSETAEREEESPELGVAAVTDKPVGLAFARAVMYRSTDYETEEDCDQAIREITKAPAWIRTRPPALYNRGVAYFQKGEYERAIEDFSESIRLCESGYLAPRPDGGVVRWQPTAAETHPPLCKRGWAYMKRGQWQNAIVDFTRVLTLVPDDLWAYSCRGAAFNEIGDYDGAIADSAAAILLNPNFLVLYINRGFAYQRKGELALAIADYSEAIRLDPKNAGLYEDRAKLYLAAGKPALALDDEVRIQELQANPQPHHWPS